MPHSGIHRYPYDIPQFPPENYPKIPKNHPFPYAVNEFFYIEALQRTKKAIDAFKRGGIKALNIMFHDHGIIGYKPLENRHHALLMPASTIENDDIWGYVNRELGIRDLARAAKRPEHSVNDAGEMRWSMTGEQECMELLRVAHPRYIYLQIDVSHKPTPIVNALRPLIEYRHKHLRSSGLKSIFVNTYRFSALTFKNIPAWLKYFRCYDLQVSQDLRPNRINHYVYWDATTGKKQRVASEALKRVRRVIEAAEKKMWPPYKPSR